MRLGKQIRIERESRGWTLEQLSERAQVDIGTISAIEVRDSMRSQYFQALAAAFGMSLDDLMRAAKARATAQEPESHYNAQRAGSPAASKPKRAQASEARTIARSIQALLRVAGVRNDLLGTAADLERKIEAELFHTHPDESSIGSDADGGEDTSRHHSADGTLDLWEKRQKNEKKPRDGKSGVVK